MLQKMSWYFIFLSIFLVTSCMSVGRKIDQTAVDSIKKGETTREQVVSLLGSPDGITRLGTGDTVYNYLYMRVSTKAASFIPIVGLFAGGANTQHQMFMVTFGPDGIVKNFYNTQAGMEADRGLITGSKPDTPDVEVGKRPK